MIKYIEIHQKCITHNYLSCFWKYPICVCQGVAGFKSHCKAIVRFAFASSTNFCRFTHASVTNNLTLDYRRELLINY